MMTRYPLVFDVPSLPDMDTTIAAVVLQNTAKL